MNRTILTSILWASLLSVATADKQLEEALKDRSPVMSAASQEASSLEAAFVNPPDQAKPWVFWFWINGNISKEGITRDLEAMKDAGINGLIWMEVSGPWWAPQGKVEAGTPEWDEAMQWAISEVDRLGMEMSLTVDFGYGAGGPHIRPDTSMQKLVFTEATVEGGKRVSIRLEKPELNYSSELKKVWLRPGAQLDDRVMKNLEEVDSYRDIGVYAVKLQGKNLKRIPGNVLHEYDGQGWTTDLPPFVAKAPAVASADVINLTDRMNAEGLLEWEAPAGKWRVMRLGHGSNFKMTRPSPTAAVGLESDRLDPRGMNAHFEHHLKPILEAAGPRAGRSLKYIHIDSWEAHGQNWTQGFEEAFEQRNGYEIDPWLPALTGIPVQNDEMTARFFRDMRATVSEQMLTNYIDRLKALSAPYGVKFSTEPYGLFCVDNLAYGGRGELPIAEFWTDRNTGRPSGKSTNFYDRFTGPAKVDKYCRSTMKTIASVANTYGRPRVGAEAFTGSRAWVDHPYFIKGAGDEAFAEGINLFVYHLYAHQAYEHMMPGLTHRRWGQHMNRFQPWWDYATPYFDYVARAQSLLQQGNKVGDIAIFFKDGAPINVKFDFTYNKPPSGYDYDFCSSEIIHQMEVKDGLLHLPSGATYRYLLLPGDGRLTLDTARKIDALHRAGATILKDTEIIGTPGLQGYPEANDEVIEMAKAWPMLPKGNWNTLLSKEKLPPDFEGGELKWTHRRVGSDEIYFVANRKYEATEQRCIFRIAGKVAELWDPETGKLYALPDAEQSDGLTAVDLTFGPAQSWFVVFRDQPSSTVRSDHPFDTPREAMDIPGPWQLAFDPNWGSDKVYTVDKLGSWSEHSDPLVKYYSGTGTYRTFFNFDARAHSRDAGYILDLGQVDVVARVTLNGQPCGEVWKAPYRVDVTNQLKPGKNELVVQVANTWVNRLIGDEQLPLDGDWKDWETLLRWPDWFGKEENRNSGRYTFTSVRHYSKNSPLRSAGLLGPLRVLQVQTTGSSEKD